MSKHLDALNKYNKEKVALSEAEEELKTVRKPLKISLDELTKLMIEVDPRISTNNKKKSQDLENRIVFLINVLLGVHTSVLPWVDPDIFKPVIGPPVIVIPPIIVNPPVIRPPLINPDIFGQPGITRPVRASRPQTSNNQPDSLSSLVVEYLPLLPTGDKKKFGDILKTIEVQAIAISRVQNQIANHKKTIDQYYKVYLDLLDPRIKESTTQLDSKLPIMLFPVRLETRFKQVGSQKQLWVRVFPDDCLVDSFDPELTKGEIESAKRFWAAWEVAIKNNDEMAKKQAWDNYVLGSAAGRALWILEEKVKTSSYKPTDAELQKSAWSHSARVNLLPERFVLSAYKNGEKVLDEIGAVIPDELICSPDGDFESENTITPKDNESGMEQDITFGKNLQWMVDFNEAVSKGMGFKINLTNKQQWNEGFDELCVLGIRVSKDKKETQSAIQNLFQNHQRSIGFGIVPNGTPTNNTESNSSGYSEKVEADETYEYLFNSEAIKETKNFSERQDGQWLADMLGLDLKTFSKTPNANGRDQIEARAMNTALWPATIGYYMKSMMGSMFKDETIEHTKQFFKYFITGRGIIPSIRIGEQPYGILPATVLNKSLGGSSSTGSSLKWLNDVTLLPYVDGNEAFSPYYYNYLKKVDRLSGIVHTDWKKIMMKQVPYIGKKGNEGQILLDILGASPSGVGLRSLSMNARYDLDNVVVKMAGWFKKHFGDDFHRVVPLYRIIAGKSIETLISSNIIDVLPLSETDTIGYLEEDKNYIIWLLNNFTSPDVIRTEEGVAHSPSLLYLMLRNAIEQAYFTASVEMLASKNLLNDAQVSQAWVEPDNLYIIKDKNKSRYSYMDNIKHADFVDNTNKKISVSNYIAQTIDLPEQAEIKEPLIEIRKSLELLEKTPTAKLDRVFREHFDLCSYRQDAWRAGLNNYRLASLRRSTRTSSYGLFSGAYGWLEDIKRNNQKLEITTLLTTDVQLKEAFNHERKGVIYKQKDNGGYIHAPSINQATTAAILRNGYISKKDDAKKSFTVNLSSQRVRQALDIIDGIRNGQSLGALLGYRLERGLHESFAPIFSIDFNRIGSGKIPLDEYIYILRDVFHLDVVIDENQNASDDEKNVANVIDGVKLLKGVENVDYPYGLDLPLKGGIVDGWPKEFSLPGPGDIIEKEIKNIQDLNDAVADLMLSESVHQAAQGNYERSAAASTDSMVKGNLPPEPEVIKTPRSGTHLTHRVGLHFEVINEVLTPSGLKATSRAIAEPSMNKWLSTVFPPVTDVGCVVEINDPVTGVVTTVTVSQANLGLQPIDLLYLGNIDSDQAMSELDDRIVMFVNEEYINAKRSSIKINLTQAIDGGYSFFELGAMTRVLRELILKSRPLRSSDLTLNTTFASQSSEKVFLDPEKIERPLNVLRNLYDGIAGNRGLKQFSEHLSTLLANSENEDAPNYGELDELLSEYSYIVKTGMEFGIDQASIGSLFDNRIQIYGNILKKVDELILRWQEKIDLFDQTLSEANDEVDEELKFRLFRKARREISTLLPETRLETIDAHQQSLKKMFDNFKIKFDSFSFHRNAPPEKLMDFIQLLSGELPIDDFDLEEFDLTDIHTSVEILVEDLTTSAGSYIKEVEKRINLTDKIMNNSGISDSEKVKNLSMAAKILFGEEFTIVPEFELPDEEKSQLEEFRLSVEKSDEILEYKTDEDSPAYDEFPVDTWLHGIARVREPMKSWETLVMFADAFNTAVPDLTPVQIPVPHKGKDNWLAVEFPEEQSLDMGRLLYTPHFSNIKETFPSLGSDSPRLCGLFIDEWTEVIPAKEENTGLAFHYDRPNSEAPQCMLLAVSPQSREPWQWNDLLETVRGTFEEAKLRAVEPQHIEKEMPQYSAVLPASVMASTPNAVSISLDIDRTIISESGRG